MERDDSIEPSATIAYGDVDFDTEASNTSANPHFADVLQKNLERRGFLKGTLGAAIGLALTGRALDAEAKTPIGAEIERNFLDIDDPVFRARAAAANVSFADQGDVLINTRLAADVAGATRMDRPEWGAVDPRTGQVYTTLTNNSARTAAQVDAANPRGPNPFGHIIRWREQNDDARSTRFDWSLLLLAGTETDSRNFVAGPNARLDAGSIHASPDGLWSDRAGLLWIETDMSGTQQSSGPFGENQMLAMDVRTGDIRRFFVGPSGQETTGVDMTPNMRTMFVNVQHPQEGRSNDVPWPDGPGTRPRSATVVITKNDGGMIGT